MKVLIVDDSIVFRTQINTAINGISGIEVASTAPNGSIALQKLEQHSIDVVTLDMEMPDMDGIEVLKRIREKNFPVKVIVFSSQTTRGAEKAIEALQNGADDIVAKPNMEGATQTPSDMIRGVLVPKILQFKPSYQTDDKPVERKSSIILDTTPKGSYQQMPILSYKPRMIMIASSTGGPNALETVFADIRPPLKLPILITQHMPPIFTQILAKRIHDLTGIPCKEGEHGEIVQPGTVYIAPGDFHMEIEGNMAQQRIKLTKLPPRNSVRPAADFMFETGSDIFADNMVGIVLTGMGEDGLEGAKRIKNQGGGMIIQSKETCVVFGMPGAVYNEGCYDITYGLKEITNYINRVAK